MSKTESKREYEKRVVSEMIGLYCHNNHHTKKGELCQECAKLNEYARKHTDRCRYMDTKTFCSNCKTSCYKPEMREQIRTVMRYAGPRMLFHRPIMAIKHLIASKKEARNL